MPLVTIVNASEALPRVALFRQSQRHPSLGASAWRVIVTPPGGTCVLEVPRACEISVSTGEPADPCGACTTRPVAMPHPHGRLVVVARPTDDRADVAPELALASALPEEEEIRVENAFSRAVWVHLRQYGVSVYPPRLVSPGEALLLDVPPLLWAAVVVGELWRGGLVPPAMSLVARPLSAGQTLTIRGSRMGGFVLEAS